jgi:uncharacterized MAPEG superfamily protein
MKVNLGCMEVPFEGPFNMAIASAGIGFGCLCTTLVFSLAEMKGPAVALIKVGADETVEACGKSMAVTVLWCFLYYNYIGIQVGTMMNMHGFKCFTPDDVTEKYAPNAARFSGNMFEQSPVFLVMLWAYTFFVDYETGGLLGLLYLVGRLLYPFFYMIFRQFVTWFEFITQIGYGVCGVYMLGVFMDAIGGAGQFASFAQKSPTLAGILGFLVGCFGVFPYCNPIGLIYGFLHYRCDRRVKEDEEEEYEDEEFEGAQE